MAGVLEGAGGFRRGGGSREATLGPREPARRAPAVRVPIGANAFLVAQSRDCDKAFVAIGSDLLVFDDMERQVERLDARIKSITEAANAIGQRLGDLQRRAEAHGAAVQDLYVRLQGPGAPGERS